jgi:hypothetical protein
MTLQVQHAQVDCLTALAMAAAEGNHVRPRLTRSNVLRITAGKLKTFMLLTVYSRSSLLRNANIGP